MIQEAGHPLPVAAFLERRRSRKTGVADLVAARERWGRTELILAAGSHDSYITPKILARDEERLRSHGIEYRVERFDGGHEVLPEVLRRIAE